MTKRVFLSPSNQADNKYAYGNTNEAVQCENISASCKAALERSGVLVMQSTRDMSMAKRCEASDNFGADVHVPIHTNAFNKNVSGTRVFCYSMTGEGYKAAKAVYDVLAPLTPGTSENVSANPNLYEVKNPEAPTVYIETDFHDVAEVAKWIIQYTEEIGEAIAEGICNYLDVPFKKKVVEKPAANDELFRVQIGAFRERANAERMLAEAKSKGFKDAWITH